MRHEHAIRLCACLSLLLISWSSSNAQELCGPGTATADLSVNNVRALIQNSGSLFYDQGAQERVYEVPEGTGANPIFDVGLWMAGEAGGSLRTAVSRYGDSDFWPGPIGAADDAIACDAYDRIFSVSDKDIQVFNATGVATADILDWPWQLGAPVHDGDDDPDNYNLTGGDRPYVHGDQTLWWILNDVSTGNDAYTRADGIPPFPVQVQVSAYGSNGLCLGGHPFEERIATALSTSTFYRYEILYRGDSPLERAYVGFFVDADLGGGGDDYMGSDSSRSLGYVYNGSDFDRVYGNRIPAIGTLVRARTPDRQLSGMSAFMWQPQNPWYLRPIDYYLSMQARFADGTALTRGRHGFNENGQATTYLFSGNPPNFWSEDNLDGNGTRSEPWDRRYVQSVGPMTLVNGDTVTLDLAIIWAGPSDRLTSVSLLKDTASRVLAVWDDVLLFDTRDCRYQPTEQLTVSDHSFALGIYPNPASEQVTLEFEIPAAGHVRVTVLDVLGRRVLVPVDGMYGSGRHRVNVRLAGLGSGVYAARIVANNLSGSRSFVIAR